jgi:hypothetical protein
VEAFRNRPLEEVYPVLWVDAMYEKFRINGRVVSMAVLIVTGGNRLAMSNPGRGAHAREIQGGLPCDLPKTSGTRLKEGLAGGLGCPCGFEGCGHRMLPGLHLARLLSATGHCVPD